LDRYIGQKVIAGLLAMVALTTPPAARARNSPLATLTSGSRLSSLVSPSPTPTPQLDDITRLLGLSRVIVLEGHLSWELPPRVNTGPLAPGAGAKQPAYRGSLTLVSCRSVNREATCVETPGTPISAAIVTGAAVVRFDLAGRRFMNAYYEFATTNGTSDDPRPGIPAGLYNVYCSYRSAQQRCATGVHLSTTSTVHRSFSLGLISIAGGNPPLHNQELFYATDRDVNDGSTNVVADMFQRDRSTPYCPTESTPTGAGVPAQQGQTEPELCLRFGTLTPVSFDASRATNSPIPSEPGLAEALGSYSNPRPSAMIIYIHGYNNRFDQAYQDASTFPTLYSSTGTTPKIPVLMFSWPANGKTLKYLDDETNLSWSATHFRELLLRLLNDPSAPPEIDLVAHSMGNRLLLDSLVYLEESHSQTTSVTGDAAVKCVIASPDSTTDANRPECHHIHEVISFEPDVDSATFFEASERVARVADGFTLYGSTADYALELSRELHGHCRAGQLFCNLDMPDRSNINLIDATIFRCDFWGHSYWAVSTTVRGDVMALLTGGQPMKPTETRPNISYEPADRNIPVPHYAFTSFNGDDSACMADPSTNEDDPNQ